MSEKLSENILNGDPAPLGLAGFAFTTFLLSFVNSGIFGGAAPGFAWLAASGTTAAQMVTLVVPLAFFWGGLAQFIAGLFEGRKGNTFGFTAFCSYGAFWLFVALFFILTGMGVLTPLGGNVATKEFGQAFGVTLILFGVFTFYMWIPAMHLNLDLNLTFLFLWLAFFLLGLGDYTNNTGLVALGGIAGLLTALFAAYGSFAIVTNSVLGVKRLPLGFAINFLGKQS